MSEPIKKILDHEVTRLVQIIAVVFSFVYFVMLPINSIEHDIETINTNHLTHIQDSLSAIVEKQEDNLEEHKEFYNRITRNEDSIDMCIDREFDK